MRLTPVLFVSHGAPDVLLAASETVQCWRDDIAPRLGKPAAVLAISAHWQAPRPTVSLATAPETIHDFGGFPDDLYEINYPAPGAPALGQRVLALLADAGWETGSVARRGLDHGAWVPLSVLFPAADVPVLSLAIPRDGSTAAHFRLGQALAALRQEGVLILASGAITHNFSWLGEANGPPRPQAKQFTEWVAEKLAAGDAAALLDYRALPQGAAAHPTPEHFLPLLVALGAAQDQLPQRFQPPYTYGSLSMDAYLWGADEVPPAAPATT